MKPQKVKPDLFKDRLDGTVIFDIPGKKFACKGLLERIDVDNSYVPKLYVHEKSNWVLIGLRDWFDRYTLYYGNYMRTKEEAMDFLAGMKYKLEKGVLVEDIVKENFQDAFRYLD